MAAGDLPRPGDTLTYGFHLADAKRIGATTTRVENTIYDTPVQRARWPAPPPVTKAGVVPAKAPDAGIVGGTVANPAEFTATLYDLDDNDGPGMKEGDEVTAYNAYTTTVATGKLIWLTRWNGFYYLLTADC